MPRVQTICVSNPQIESSAIKSHATFQITSRILYDFNGEENSRETIVTVRRRYREFALLQECLRANNPGCILPPLPPPTVHLKLSDELINQRLVLLQRYLDSVLQHRQLYTDPSFWLFVQSGHFADMIEEFKLLQKGSESIPPKSRGGLRDSPRYTDSLEDRLDYLIKITARLEILKSSLTEFFDAKRLMAEQISELGKSLVGYLDAATDTGRHAQLVHVIDSLQIISDRFLIGTNQMDDAKSFIIIIDDYIRMMQEVEQTFALKRAWRAAVYTLEIRIIDTRADLIKSQNDRRRNFDKNYRMSEAFLKMREELREASRIYESICHKMSSEIDRIDSQRMQEMEKCINKLLKDLLDAQSEVVDIWETFLASNDSTGNIWGWNVPSLRL